MKKPNSDIENIGSFENIMDTLDDKISEMGE